MSRRGSAGRFGSLLSRRALLLVAIVVVLLVLIDVGLVVLALARTAPTSNGTIDPVPTFSSTPARSPSRSASATPSATATAGAEVPGGTGQRLLAAVDGHEAWRASGGACGGDDGTLEHTVDGGQTWSRAATQPGHGVVLSLQTEAGRLTVLVGEGAECTPTAMVSTDGARTWSGAGAEDAGAAITPDGLVAGGVVAPPPCADPLEAFQGQYTTAVVCKDEVQWRSGAGAWVGVPISGVRSLADDGNSYLLAREGVSGCSGVEVASMPAAAVTPTTTSERVGCAADSDADSGEKVVLARGGPAAWLWSGDAVRVSTDGGATW